MYFCGREYHFHLTLAEMIRLFYGVEKPFFIFLTPHSSIHQYIKMLFSGNRLIIQVEYLLLVPQATETLTPQIAMSFLCGSTFDVQRKNYQDRAFFGDLGQRCPNGLRGILVNRPVTLLAMQHSGPGKKQFQMVCKFRYCTHS